MYVPEAAIGRLATNSVVIFRHGERRLTERLADHTVRVEVNLPVTQVIAVGPHGENRAGEIEGKNLHIGRWLSENIRNGSEARLQELNSCSVISAVV